MVQPPAALPLVDAGAEKAQLGSAAMGSWFGRVLAVCTLLLSHHPFPLCCTTEPLPTLAPPALGCGRR